MCTVSAPKPQPVQDKPVQYLANPWLDGATIGGQTSGRNSLRIDRTTPGASPTGGSSDPGVQAAAGPTPSAPGFPGVGVVAPSFPPGLLIGGTRPRLPTRTTINA